MRFKDVARALLLTGAVASLFLLLVPTRRRRYTLVGNERTKVYHHPGCRFALDTDTGVPFRDAAAAETAGYRPCRICIG